uniref:hypothetical protein n=1 Tax=Coprococcus catus TaxID=116085 RepID=UPI0022E8F5CB|nr:hypothetical protein [Coprococcus catus]
MIEIRINNTGDSCYWLYGKDELWKNYVHEDFDEHVVLYGNRSYNGCKEASWYERAMEILNDIDNWDEYPEDLPGETNEKLKELYDGCRNINDIVVDVIKLLYPNDKFKSGTLTGYCQGDWEYYIVKGDVDTELLEALYFNKIVDVTVIDGNDNISGFITDDDLWKAERNGTLGKLLRERFDIPDEEDVKIYKADGYKKIIDWQEVC